MLSTKRLLTKILNALKYDYIVDEGTSGGWRYRKWNSGVYECWRSYSSSIAVTTTNATYGGYRSDTVNIPAFPITFASTPVVTAAIGSGSQGCWVNNVQPTVSGGTFYLSAGASNAAATRTVFFHVFGTWQ